MTSISYQDTSGEIKDLLLENRSNKALPFICDPEDVRKHIEIKGVHLKSSVFPKHAQKSAWRMAIGKPTVMDLERANHRRRVRNTKRNRDIIIQDLVNKGYSRVESKARLLKTVVVINGRSYLLDQRPALNKHTLHKDLFALPTRPGILFRHPLPGTQLFAAKPQLFVQKKDYAKEPFDIDKAMKEGLAMFAPNHVGGFDLVNNENIKDKKD